MTKGSNVDERVLVIPFRGSESDILDFVRAIRLYTESTTLAAELCIDMARAMHDAHRRWNDASYECAKATKTEAEKIALLQQVDRARADYLARLRMFESLQNALEAQLAAMEHRLIGPYAADPDVVETFRAGCDAARKRVAEAYAGDAAEPVDPNAN